MRRDSDFLVYHTILVQLGYVSMNCTVVETFQKTQKITFAMHSYTRTLIHSRHSNGQHDQTQQKVHCARTQITNTPTININHALVQQFTQTTQR